MLIAAFIKKIEVIYGHAARTAGTMINEKTIIDIWDMNMSASCTERDGKESETASNKMHWHMSLFLTTSTTCICNSLYSKLTTDINTTQEMSKWNT